MRLFFQTVKWWFQSRVRLISNTRALLRVLQEKRAECETLLKDLERAKRIADEDRKEIAQLQSENAELRGKAEASKLKVGAALSRKFRRLEERARFAEQERDSMQRQRDTALDMLDRTAWQARWGSAQHKAAVESIADQGGEQ